MERHCARLQAHDARQQITEALPPKTRKEHQGYLFLSISSITDPVLNRKASRSFLLLTFLQEPVHSMWFERRMTTGAGRRCEDLQRQFASCEFWSEAVEKSP